MMHIDSDLTQLLQLAEDNLLPLAFKGIKDWLKTDNLPERIRRSLIELLALQAWDERLALEPVV